MYISDNYPTYEYQADLIDNTANNNTYDGFYADAPAKGNGNKAHGNHPNCYHVSCS